MTGKSPNTPLSVSDPRFAPLAQRYFERTERSRALAAESRRRLADSRGFLRLHQGWEGMVYPVLCAESQGSHLCDVDGNDYVDLTMGFGVNLFGHHPSFVDEALARQLRDGWNLAADVESSYEVAEQICGITGADRSIFTTTGSEAVLVAVRLARTVTGREKIAMFTNSYHGWYDETFARPAELSAAGPRGGILGGIRAGDGHALPASPGVPAGATREVLLLDYGEQEALRRIREAASELSAVLVEPVQTRAPELQPGTFLAELRTLCDETGVVLIFDEMVTGFRIAAGGAQDYFGVQADIGAYGKILGGGMPMGVVAGQAELLAAADGGAEGFMDADVARRPNATIAGTFSKHPLAMAAARAVLTRIEQLGPDLYSDLDRTSGMFADELQALFDERGAPFWIGRCGSMVRVHAHDQVLRELLSYHLVARGVYVSEGRTWLVSTAHDEADLAVVLRAVEDCLSDMAEFW